MEKVFSYGTLQDPVILKGLIGRLPKMQADTLKGFKIGYINIDDGQFLIVEPDLDAPIINGVVLEITTEELEKFDAYETSAYQRQLETLASGTKAWVYQK